MVRLDLFAITAAALAGQALASPLKGLESQGRAQFDALLAKSKTCTKDKLMMRREWGDVPPDERRAYISAVLCLQESPSKLDQKLYPGAKTRFDDFAAVHINQTLSAHSTGSFFSWHRYFVWAYEYALRTECGYNGTQPYWDWAKWADDPESSPLFDGSDTSLGGNGQKTRHAPFNFAPAGNGGGCVTTGPFKNMVVRLGPISSDAHPQPPSNPQDDGFGDNPRCLRRDIGPYLPTHYGTYDRILGTVENNTNILDFQFAVQDMPPHGTVGLHGMGHYTIGGDPGGDFFAAAGDPAFFVHHAMVDRVWTIWQNMDLDNRLMAMEGPTSMEGSGVQTLDDIVDLGVVVDKTLKIRDLMSTVDGPFCYAYV